MAQTHLITDGLQDPNLGRLLSHAWAAAGFENAVDVTGQAAWVALPGGREGFAKPQVASAGGDSTRRAAETEMDRAAAIARGFGLEIRDRVGSAFVAANDLAALRGRVVYEYKSRFATALMFGLPALVLHYVGPHLAGGSGDARTMLLPWIIEFLLVGWMCIAAGWPVLWQGGLSLLHLRASADLLTSAIVFASLIYSGSGIINAAVSAQPWFAGGGNPMLYAANLAVMLAVLQRWLTHHFAERIGGRANLLVPHLHRLIFLWLIAAIAVVALRDWETGLAFALAFPPMLGLATVNRRTPGPTALLPVPAFALTLLIAPRAFNLNITGIAVEIAAAFTLMMTAVMVLGWQGMRHSNPKIEPQRHGEHRGKNEGV